MCNFHASKCIFSIRFSRVSTSFFKLFATFPTEKKTQPKFLFDSQNGGINLNHKTAVQTSIKCYRKRETFFFFFFLFRASSKEDLGGESFKRKQPSVRIFEFPGFLTTLAKESRKKQLIQTNEGPFVELCSHFDVRRLSLS